MRKGTTHKKESILKMKESHKRKKIDAMIGRRWNVNYEEPKSSRWAKIRGKFSR